MAASWRVARSLDQLLAQINAAHPKRSKAADGSIGDAAHASTTSEHNPDRNGVVRARDFTHDPTHGFDAHAMADALVASRDPRILYVISRGRICSSVVRPWVWRAYTGSNRHDHHAHVSVVAEPRLYDSVRPWTITSTKPQPNKEIPVNTKDANLLWTTPQTKTGTIGGSETNESPLAILTRVARNVEALHTKVDELTKRVAELEAPPK